MRKITVLGTLGLMPDSSALGIYSTGYPTRLFTARESSSKSNSRVSGSMTTFSTREPKRMAL